MKRNDVRRIEVFYSGWGEDWPLGVLARANQHTHFAYSDAAMANGIEFSPLHLPLAAKTYEGFDAHQSYLPGFIDDSLPDGWGRLLWTRRLKLLGIEFPDAFDLLAFIGEGAMGALRFEPTQETKEQYPDWSLKTLAEHTHRLATSDQEEALAQLAMLGGSPHGARPKALVSYRPNTQQVFSKPREDAEPWLFKFPARSEAPEVCALEHFYMDIARVFGLSVPQSVYIPITDELAAFGVRRFDREHGQRVPMLTLSGLLHADFRMPGNVGYREWIEATRFLTHSEHEVRRAFHWMLFNILFHNRDDHPKNLGWILNADKTWVVSPSYDLTFSYGPGGEHHLDIAGKGNDIQRADLAEFCAQHAIPPVFFEQLREQAHTAFEYFVRELPHLPLPNELRNAVLRAVTRAAEGVLG